MSSIINIDASSTPCEPSNTRDRVRAGARIGSRFQTRKRYILWFERVAGSVAGRNIVAAALDKMRSWREGLVTHPGDTREVRRRAGQGRGLGPEFGFYFGCSTGAATVILRYDISMV